MKISYIKKQKLIVIQIKNPFPDLIEKVKRLLSRGIFSDVKDKKVRKALIETANSMKNNPFVSEWMFKHYPVEEYERLKITVPEFITDPSKRDNTGEPEDDPLGVDNLDLPWWKTKG